MINSQLNFPYQCFPLYSTLSCGHHKLAFTIAIGCFRVVMCNNIDSVIIVFRYHDTIIAGDYCEQELCPVMHML